MDDIVAWASILATVFAGIGLLATAYQIRKASRRDRVQRVAEYARDLFDDPDLRETYYRVEYGKFQYDKSFHESETEQKIDNLLGRLDSLAKQVQMGAVELEDLDLVAYRFVTVYQDRGVQDYFRFLDGWYKERRLSRVPFHAFREVGARLESAMTLHDRPHNPPLQADEGH